MSAGPANALGAVDAGSPQIAGSAVVLGAARLGEGSLLAEGAVIRSGDSGVGVGAGSAVLENSVVVGNDGIPTTIGRRTVFAHRCLVIGATVGDMCEIGNASTLMPGAQVGDRVFLGEGTLVPSGMTLPSEVVAVGRPAYRSSIRGRAGRDRVRRQCRGRGVRRARGCGCQATFAVRGHTEIDGFPAVAIGRLSEPPRTPLWALRPDDLPAQVPSRR